MSNSPFFCSCNWGFAGCNFPLFVGRRLVNVSRKIVDVKFRRLSRVFAQLSHHYFSFFSFGTGLCAFLCRHCFPFPPPRRFTAFRRPLWSQFPQRFAFYLLLDAFAPPLHNIFRNNLSRTNRSWPQKLILNEKDKRDCGNKASVTKTRFPTQTILLVWKTCFIEKKETGCSNRGSFFFCLH